MQRLSLESGTVPPGNPGNQELPDSTGCCRKNRCMSHQWLYGWARRSTSYCLQQKIIVPESLVDGQTS